MGEQTGFLARFLQSSYSMVTLTVMPLGDPVCLGRRSKHCEGCVTVVAFEMAELAVDSLQGFFVTDTRS